jgi:hypothetical protein
MRLKVSKDFFPQLASKTWLSPFSIIRELVEDCYDEDAVRVIITLGRGYAVVEDDVGMDGEVLGRFLTIRTNTSSSGAVFINPIFRCSCSSTFGMLDIHQYERRLENARERIRSLPDSDFLQLFIDHLRALGLSTRRAAKYANHIYTLMRRCPFDPQHATRRDMENVIAWINSQPYKSSTKEDLKIYVRKIVQYAKYGSCSRKTPLPLERSHRNYI